jgi:hypothetical protein
MAQQLLLLRNAVEVIDLYAVVVKLSQRIAMNRAFLICLKYCSQHAVNFGVEVMANQRQSGIATWRLYGHEHFQRFVVK